VSLDPSASSPPSGRRRVHSRVALVMLETLRAQDLPTEILDDENVTITLPRRLGLSDVIEAQIRRYRSEARRRRRVPEQEIVDLLRLVIRRPDSEDVFLEVGRALYTPVNGGIGRFLSRGMALALARRRVQRDLRRLFGRRLVRSGGKGFVLDHAHDLLIRGDPGGDACALVTGLCERVVEGYVGPGGAVLHVHCLGRGEAKCRWEFQEPTVPSSDG
jgi:hypothetical protein